MPIAALGPGVLCLLALAKSQMCSNVPTRTNFDTCSFIRIMSVVIHTKT